MYINEVLCFLIVTCVQDSEAGSTGMVREFHWFDSWDLAIKRAFQWCEAHGHAPDDWVVKKIDHGVQVTPNPGHRKLVLCNGPQFRVELRAQMRTQ